MRLPLALALFAHLLFGCASARKTGAAPARPPRPPQGSEAAAAYDGHLRPGTLVRGVVEVYDAHTLVVTHRTGARRSEVEFVEFPKAAHFEPPPGGVMVVFRVGRPSTYHTPDDDQGSHDWIEAFACELVAVEASRAQAVAAARRCVPEGALPQDRDGLPRGREAPWAFGPSARGGWLVRFAGSTSEIEVEVDRALSCAVPR